MNKMQEHFLRTSLKPTVESDLPGRLRIGFRRYNLLPDEARPYLHYVREVLAMLPGVADVSVNARIGTILITYDATVTSTRQILRWVDIVVDTGIQIANERNWQASDEAELERLVRARLVLRLPRQKEGLKHD